MAIDKTERYLRSIDDSLKGILQELKKSNRKTMSIEEYERQIEEQAKASEEGE